LKLAKVACLIQDVVHLSPQYHTVVMKEWHDVERDVLCQITLSWCYIIGMWEKTQ